MTHIELTDHCSLNYRVDGHLGGCPLLLFNGVSLPLDIWGSLATRLAADRQVIRFDQPTLLVYGRHDRNGTPENGRDLAARIPGSRLVEIEDAGHFVVREAELRVVTEIATFLEGIAD